MACIQGGVISELYAAMAENRTAPSGAAATFKDGLRELELCGKIIESSEKRS
jgi:hypothetical protein